MHFPMSFWNLFGKVTVFILTALQVAVTVFFSKFRTYVDCSVIGGIFIFTPKCETLESDLDLEMDSSSVVQAMDNIMDRFYKGRANTVFIMYQMLLISGHSPNPIELAGEVVRFEMNRISMLYVIENYVTVKDATNHRSHNVFIVDSYEGFR